MLNDVLRDNHQDLYQWFLFHQECLLLNHEEYAAQCLHVFQSLLKAHIDFENQQLLSPTASTCSSVARM